MGLAAPRLLWKGTRPVNEQPTQRSGTQLPPGERAPDFTLSATPDQRLSLAEMRGRPVILAFYPADWSPVCGDEMSLLNEVLPAFHRFGAQLVGISTDGVWCHAAFAAERKLHFPLLADFEPKGEVARLYGVYRAAEGIAERRCSSSTPAGSFVGPMFRRSGSIPAPTGSSTRSRAFRPERRRRSRVMSHAIPPLAADDHIQGPSDAAMTLVEYGDYQCPYCGEAYPSSRPCSAPWAGSFASSSGTSRWWTCTSMPARRAEFAEAAAEAGVFWQAHDLLFENQDALDGRSLAAYGERLGSIPP